MSVPLIIPLDDPTLATRFWSKVDKRGQDECWLWTSGTNLGGYGRGWCRGKTVAAHRVAWSLTNGPVQDGLFVLHRCDVRLCCNPDHLFLGTSEDNMADMTAKGRAATGDKNGRRKHPERYECMLGDGSWTRKYPERVLRGAKHGMSKVNEAAVLEMRELRRRGATLAQIGARFLITPSNVHCIVTYRTWKHIP